MDEHDQYEQPNDEILQDLILRLITGDDLDQLCAEADLPPLTDQAGHPVTISAAHTYRDAGVLTLNPGVRLSLSDGTTYGLTITVAH